MSKVQRPQANVFSALASEAKQVEKAVANELQGVEKSLAGDLQKVAQDVADLFQAQTPSDPVALAPKAEAKAHRARTHRAKTHHTRTHRGHKTPQVKGDQPQAFDKPLTKQEIADLEAKCPAFKAAVERGPQTPPKNASADRNTLVHDTLVWSSPKPGMGAIPYDGGTTFRTWAPNASQVFVAGDFDGWMPQELGNEFNGNFSADIAGARPGQGYKFLIRNGNNWFWRIDPRAQQVSNSTGNGIIHDRNAYQWQHDLDFKMPPKNQTVMYEMNVDTYQGFFGGHGTWNSAADKLQHLKDLGINMIELMPSAEFPGDTSWGYNPADPFAPESAFGSPEDMKRFIDTAHSMGIGVTLDVVYNHFGPSDLSMWDYDGTGYQGDGGIYFYNDNRQGTPWGPRPNYGRKEVQDYIVDNAMQWLGEYHLDGLRLDATENIRSAAGADNPDGWNVLKRINAQAHQQWPWKRIIAEDMQDNGAITQQNGAGFDEQWDPDFYSKVDANVLKANDGWIDMNQVKDAILHTMDGNPFDRVVYSQSHDEVANGKQYLESMVDPGNSGSWFAKKKQTLAAAIALTSAGTPMLFQGQEFNQGGYFQAEKPLDWNNLNWFGGINQMYTDMIHLRRNWFNNTQGLSGANTNVFHVNNNDKVIAYQRWDKGGNGDDTIVIANFSDKTMNNYDLGFPSDGNWKVRFNSDAKTYSPDFGSTSVWDVNAHWGGKDGMPANGTINLPPYSVIILSKDR